MRYLIALMAILGLLVTPVAAAAAQVVCDHSQAMSVMDQSDGAMPAMPGMDDHAKASGQDASADPCCDHHGGSKMDGQSCALACASVGAPLVAAPDAPFGLGLAYARAPEALARTVWAKPYDPLGLERPPKAMA